MSSSRQEISGRLDELKGKITELKDHHEPSGDLWCELADSLEGILESCSAEDLLWFHDRADELVVHLFKRLPSH